MPLLMEGIVCLPKRRSVDTQTMLVCGLNVLVALPTLT